MLELPRLQEFTKKQRFEAIESAEADAARMTEDAKRLNQKTWVVAKFECKCGKKHFFGGELKDVWSIIPERLCPRKSKRAKLVKVYLASERGAKTWNEYPPSRKII